MSITVDGTAVELQPGKNYLIITDYNTTSIASLQNAVTSCRDLGINLIPIRVRGSVNSVRICGPIEPENVNYSGESE